MAQAPEVLCRTMKLNVAGTIDDEKGISIDFTEKNVIKIEVEFGDKKLFYEVNDEFNNYKKIVESLKKLIELKAIDRQFTTCSELQKLLTLKK